MTKQEAFKKYPALKNLTYADLVLILHGTQQRGDHEFSTALIAAMAPDTSAGPLNY